LICEAASEKFFPIILAEPHYVAARILNGQSATAAPTSEAPWEAAPRTVSPPIRRTGPPSQRPHSGVERHYRGKLNDRMMQLHRTSMASEATSMYVFWREITALGNPALSAKEVGIAEP
jgi:hypothetical protein